MFNKFKTTTLAAVTAAATLLGGGQVWAFDNTDVAWSGTPFGTCQAEIYVQTGGTAALVAARPAGTRASPGGVQLSNGSLQPYYSGSNVTSSFLSANCNLSNITNFSSTPLTNWATATYWGYSFRATDNATGVISDYEFALSGASNTQRIATITPILPLNVAPTANAGPDQSVASATAPVTLDGTGSTDPDAGQTLTYAWTQTAGPTVTLSDATAASPTFTAPTLNIGDPDAVLTFSLMVTDNLGEPAAAADTVAITVTAPLDTTPPTVTLSSTTTTLTGTAPFTITATFDEDVTGFDDLVNDITIANGTVTGITAVSATVYTLAVTPTGAGDVSITVPAAAAQDLASNNNTASNTLVIGNTIVEDTQKAIAGFMLGRANNLASNQTGLTQFLMGDGCGSFNASATEGSASVNGCVSSGNAWASLTSARAGSDSYTLGTIGAHTVVNPNLLIGGMFQYDHSEDSANNASGTGYMVGPYFVAKLPEQPLFLEGRLLYGQTDNEISPLGTYTDSFETERWLAQLRTTGEYKLQATTLMPLLDFTYTDDTQKAYIDSLGNTIPGQTVSLIQITAGMDFSTPIPVSTGALELTGGFSGVYSATDGGAATPEFENWRGRTHLGLNYDTGTGATMNVGAFYDGIGTNYESYGATVGFDMKF